MSEIADLAKLASPPMREPRPAAVETSPMTALDLYWLPAAEGWPERIKKLERQEDLAAAWNELVALANTRMDFIRMGRLEKTLRRLFGDAPPKGLATKPVRLAILGSSTLAHLHPALRIAALRRGIWLTSYECHYDQYMQELTDPQSDLFKFKPNAVLFAFDAHHLMRGVDPAADSARAEASIQEILTLLKDCWKLARDAFRCPIIQQTVMPIFPPLLGSNEHRLPGSRHRVTAAVNAALRPLSDEFGIDLLSIDTRAAIDGMDRWHNLVLWHRAKQEVGPTATPLYGDLAVRLLAAKQGRSAKCLVLDLDNTLWGGVIGDDGLEGVVLGQGSAAGEAFVAFQSYARDLAKRGIILAVCSKNDEANALSPFEQHPEMVLKRADIACFVANWQDKATNIRNIAQQLNIGLDSLVFVDDNPFERNLVRTELPMVAVPEVTDDPALFSHCLVDAGYFESLSITDEDRERTQLYQANAERDTLQASSTDLPSYLRNLQMDLLWRPFDKIGLQRTVQLINKTNQFNLTTQRYTEEDVQAVMQDPKAFGLQLRLIDRFGDNGIIAVVIGRMRDDKDLFVDTWLMSCRVLGRQVEEATLRVIAGEARRLGARRIIGEFKPTAKNAMVKNHYAKLGFSPLSADADGNKRDVLDLETFVLPEVIMTIREG
jgi:FkbH-like protein